MPSSPKMSDTCSNKKCANFSLKNTSRSISWERVTIENTIIIHNKRVTIFFTSPPPFWVYYSIIGGICKVKYSACAECEIISLWEIVKYLTSFDVKWNSPFTFAKQIFHSGAISLGGAKFHSPQANFVEKRGQVFRLALFFLEACWQKRCRFKNNYYLRYL